MCLSNAKQVTRYEQIDTNSLTIVTIELINKIYSCEHEVLVCKYLLVSR